MAGFLSGSTSEQAPLVRPKLQLGAGLDVIHGHYARGMKNEMIINGGQPNLGGGTAIGNGGKTAMGIYQLAVVLIRYRNSTGRVQDAELTLEAARVENAIRNALPPEMDFDEFMESVETHQRLHFSDTTVLTASEHHESVREGVRNRLKDKKAKVETPFRDRDGTPIMYFDPHVEFVDSFSAYTPDAVVNMREKADAGDSGRNMEALTNARVKTQMLSELMNDCAKAGVYYWMTAHMGEQHELDPYKPAKEKLAELKRGLKMKDVPEKITFYPGIFWWGYATKSLLDDKKKPLFPMDNDFQNDKGSVDLKVLHLCTIRNKSGPTGEFHEVIMSQTKGIQSGMTEFWNCLRNSRFGIMGKDGNENNLINFYAELRPNVPLTRQNIYRKITTDKLLARAINITSEMQQMYKMWQLPESWICSPKELYDDLIAKGYDWDVLLNTRGYWTYDQYTHEVPFLSSIDLLRMRAGEYHPYWMGELPNAQTEPSQAA